MAPQAAGAALTTQDQQQQQPDWRSGLVAKDAPAAAPAAAPSFAAGLVTKSEQAPRTTPIGATLPADVAARHARANAGKVGMPTAAEEQAQQPGVGQNIAEGAGKSAAQGIQGATKLANKVLPNAAQIPVPGDKMDLEAHGVAQNIGAMGEQGAEWAIGEEVVGALSELSKASKYLKTPAMLQQYLAKSPKVAKALETIAHGIGLGAAQGAVHGAAQDDAAGGAKAGAIGGAAGGAVAEATGAVAPRVAKILGLGGLTAEENMTKAAGGSLNVGTQNWEGTLQKALPVLAEANKKTPISTVGEFEDLAHDTADKLWKQQIQPKIDANVNEHIAGGKIAKNLINGISEETRELFPQEAQEATQFADKLDKDMTLGKAQKYLELLNAKLKSYYKMGPDGRHAAGITDAVLDTWDQAAKGLREEIYGVLDSKAKPGEKLSSDLRQQYGALKEVQRVFGKRAIVADRQMPLNMSQVLSMIGGSIEAFGALKSGHPAEAALGAVPLAVASAARLHNAPENLIKTAMSQTSPGIVRRTAQAAAGPATAGAAAAGAQAGQWVRFQAKNGQTYRVHPDDLKAAQDRGLVDKVLQ